MEAEAGMLQVEDPPEQVSETALKIKKKIHKNSGDIAQ